MKPLVKTIGASVLGLMLIASLAGNVVLFRQVDALKNDPEYKATKENATTLAAVGKLMVLPDEEPTIATVTDPEKLKGQSFFDNAKMGDRVLIFSKAKKAVLYDPVANRIVEVAPLQTSGIPGDLTAQPPASEDGSAPADESDAAVNKPTTTKKTAPTAQ